MTTKKLHRFLISTTPEGESITITDERIVHQTGHVLKMVVGESFIVFESDGPDVVVKITAISKKHIEVQKVDTIAPLLPSRNLIAAIAIAKGDTFELIVQKLTEIGVSTIVPIITSRTIKQSVRVDRLQIISDEALEQCGGSIRVNIVEPTSLKECLAQFPFPSIAFQAGADTRGVGRDSAVMYVGPEGGWSADDIAQLDAYHVTWQGLGDRVLRTETAAIVGAYRLLQ